MPELQQFLLESFMDGSSGFFICLMRATAGLLLLTVTFAFCSHADAGFTAWPLWPDSRPEAQETLGRGQCCNCSTSGCCSCGALSCCQLSELQSCLLAADACAFTQCSQHAGQWVLHCLSPCFIIMSHSAECLLAGSCSCYLWGQ